MEEHFQERSEKKMLLFSSERATGNDDNGRIFDPCSIAVAKPRHMHDQPHSNHFKSFQIIANLTIFRSSKNENKTYRVIITSQWCDNQPSNEQQLPSYHPPYQEPSLKYSTKQLQAHKVLCHSLLLLRRSLVLSCRWYHVVCSMLSLPHPKIWTHWTYTLARILLFVIEYITGSCFG